MRSAFDPQLRFDCPVVPDVRLNTDCRDEIIPILRALQHIYGRPELRDELLDAVAHDVNGTTRADQGRPGMAYSGTAQIAAFLCSKSRVGSCRRSATCSVEMTCVMAWRTTKTSVILEHS